MGMNATQIILSFTNTLTQKWMTPFNYMLIVLISFNMKLARP